MGKKISYTGILLALNIILLILSNIIPVNTLFFMGLASLIVAIVVLEYGFKMGVVFYIASSILSFFIIMNKSQWLLYVSTFALYGLIKYIIENGRSIYLEIFLKLVFANSIMIFLICILKGIIFIPVNIVSILLFQIIFLVYDYVYTLFIDYYETKLRKIIK
ncbi:hypothetical protein [Paraclostridium sordellii]|uniref:hypothetical protein n=1 Tax=Paraclostridium sordellii TaxID=1505 RepID=UPI0005DE3E0D|nr:hypothetical protein [Paeniclostridium sordellii]CEO31245.1 membrane protein [[Clostridium] sordellii] [Paeniclostridium sordellii]CEP49707.1 membrane protein [[Clostridium] sordellii] [Paeniclostridium sordellii]